MLHSVKHCFASDGIVSVGNVFLNYFQLKCYATTVNSILSVDNGGKISCVSELA